MWLAVFIRRGLALVFKFQMPMKKQSGGRRISHKKKSKVDPELGRECCGYVHQQKYILKLCLLYDQFKFLLVYS